MPRTDLPLALLIDPTCMPERAEMLARSLALPVIDEKDKASLLLRLTGQHLELCKPGDPELPGSLWVDFTKPSFRRRYRQPGRELLVQAARIRKKANPLAIDATAGLGRDGFLLAAAGFQVLMFERNPVVAALLRDGLDRAAAHPETAAIAQRIELIPGDVRSCLQDGNITADVISLDPMFPARIKSAKVKQELQLLQQLEGCDVDGEELLRLALRLQPRKIVVKRPLNGQPLLAIAPAYALRGKSVRFDVYVGMTKEV